MNISNRITQLFGIKYPIIQAGMVWVSGWRLASAVSNEGGLGLIGAGSMKPELLAEHIDKCKLATEMSFGVNIPLLRGDAEDLIDVVLNKNVKIIFTSAGHPGKFIEKLKSAGCSVTHVVSNVKQALKAESVGCDAIVAEGVEAGGHNGIDEITTFSLIPQVADAVKIPIIAAGGIADGRGIIAAIALGAEGVQIGTGFAATEESSAHQNYKNAIISASDNSTLLILKKVGMARVIKNKFAEESIQKEYSGASKEEMIQLVGKKREMLAIFEGDIENGMPEAGQSSGLIVKLISVKEYFSNLLSSLQKIQNRIQNFS